MSRSRGGSALDSLLGMSREMDRLAGSMWPDAENGGLVAMPAEVVETDDEIRFEVEMPGFRNEDLDITLENNVLTIAGEKQESRSQSDEKNTWHLNERRYGHLSRSFVLPRDVDQEGISAGFENGILTVTVPKSERARRRRIEVKPDSGRQDVSTGT